MQILRSGGSFFSDALRLMRLGAMAPSRHNTQPWKFSIHKNTIQIHPDFTRRLTVIDPEDRSVYLSLGCATENIVIAAEYYGFSTELDHSVNRKNGSVLIHLTPARCESSTSELISGMALRQCNRRPFEAVNISRRDLGKLMVASRQPGVEFGLLTEANEIKKIAEAVRTSRRDGVRTTSFAAELASWTRFNRREAESKRDGLLFTEMGYPPLPRCIGRRLVAILVGANQQRERSASLVRNSSALMYFAPHRDDQFHWFNVGRSFQRVTLTAASLRIRYGHLQLPYSSPANSEDLGRCFGGGVRQALLVARLGYSHVAPHSLRRPLCRMLTEHPQSQPARKTGETSEGGSPSESPVSSSRFAQFAQLCGGLEIRPDRAAG